MCALWHIETEWQIQTIHYSVIQESIADLYKYMVLKAPEAQFIITQ